MSTNYPLGIDVSYAQDEMDWDKAKSQGIDFAFARANYGLKSQDSQFHRNWSEMKRVGLLRGLYAFFFFNEDPIAQADFTLKILQQAGGDSDLPLVLDIEKYVNNGVDSTSAAHRVEATQQWLTYIEKQTGRRPIIYTSYYEWSITVNSTAFNDYPLWVANPSQAAQPYMPVGWDKWLFWQFASDGDNAGSRFGAQSSSIDINRFNGSLAELQALGSRSSSDQTIPTTPPAPKPTSYTVQAGDNLAAIAANFNTTVAAISQLNNISDPNLIYVGQTLKLP